MSWSYSGNPANSDSDAVRFLIGDTNTSDQLLSNEEIAYLLTLYGNVYSAAAVACRSIAAKYARTADKYVGDLRIQWSQRGKAYLALADSLDSQAALVGVSPYLGGNSVSEKDSEEADTSKVQPYFKRNQFDDLTDSQNELI